MTASLSSHFPTYQGLSLTQSQLLEQFQKDLATVPFASELVNFLYVLEDKVGTKRFEEHTRTYLKNIAPLLTQFLASYDLPSALKQTELKNALKKSSLSKWTLVHIKNLSLKLEELDSLEEEGKSLKKIEAKKEAEIEKIVGGLTQFLNTIEKEWGVAVPLDYSGSVGSDEYSALLSVLSGTNCELCCDNLFDTAQSENSRRIKEDSILYFLKKCVEIENQKKSENHTFLFDSQLLNDMVLKYAPVQHWSLIRNYEATNPAALFRMQLKLYNTTTPISSDTREKLLVYVEKINIANEKKHLEESIESGLLRIEKKEKSNFKL